MSYVRFSKGSDVYCYANCNGLWTTHVARNRRVNEPDPIPLPSQESDVEGWLEAHQAYMRELKACAITPIGLAYDGESYDDDGPEGMLERLTLLRSAGYNIPDYVFDSLRDEIANPEVSDDE